MIVFHAAAEKACGAGRLRCLCIVLVNGKFKGCDTDASDYNASMMSLPFNALCRSLACRHQEVPTSRGRAQMQIIQDSSTVLENNLKFWECWHSISIEYSRTQLPAAQ